jgi:HlyD family secretion protein
MKKRKYLYLGIAAIIIIVGGYFLFFYGGSDDIVYRTEKVSRGDILLQVRATGTVNPVRTVQVGSQVSGIIEKLYVDFNSKVKKGEILAQIDSTFLYASVKEAEASYERTHAQVNEAERSYNRTTELYKKNLVSQADLDAAETAYESAVAQQKQAQGSLDRAKVNLRYAVITSPIDGVVISRDIDVGQTVASSFQTPKLFSIAMDLSHMQVEASVDEADIGQVKVGQDVTFTVDSYADEQFVGRVSQVRLSPVIVQNVVTYTVIIDVENPDLKLRPGMTATVSILVDTRKEILRIPALAIRFQPPQEVLETIQKSEKETSGEKKTDEKQITEARGKDTASTRLTEFSQRRPNEGERGMNRQEQGMRKMQNPQSGERMGNKLESSAKNPIANKFAQVWILESGKTLKSLRINTGISDSRYVELVSGELKENDEVIVGTLSNGNNTASRQASPFGPQMMGGGPRR